MKKRGSLSKEVFLEAARMVAEGRQTFSCVALFYAKRKLTKEFTTANFNARTEERDKFIRVMLGGDEFSGRFYKQKHLRVIALCFMAAMED